MTLADLIRSLTGMVHQLETNFFTLNFLKIQSCVTSVIFSAFREFKERDERETKKHTENGNNEPFFEIDKLNL